MCDWQYLITVYSYIFILVTMSFKEPKFSMLIKSSLLIFFFSFMDGASCTICKKSLPNPRSQGIIVWDFTFKSVVRFKSIFHVVKRNGSNWVLFFHIHLVVSVLFVENIIFLHGVSFTSLSNQFPYMHETVS